MLTGSGLALSGAHAPRPGCGSQHPPRFACVLLAAAPTAPPCFRRWRRSSPLLPKGEPLAYRTAFCQTPKVYSDVKDSALLQRAAASEQASLSSCCESLSQGTTFYDNKSFVRPAWALPVRQWLPLWGSHWQSHQALTERALGKMIFTAKNPFWLSVVRVPLYF